MDNSELEWKRFQRQQKLIEREKKKHQKRKENRDWFSELNAKLDQEIERCDNVLNSET
jgi:hypothetical protein